MTSLEFDLLKVKYDNLAKSQKRASISFNESAMKSGCLSPVKSLFSNLILTLIIFRDKIIGAGGQNVNLTFRFPLSIIQTHISDPAVHNRLEKTRHNNKIRAKRMRFGVTLDTHLQQDQLTLESNLLTHRDAKLWII